MTLRRKSKCDGFIDLGIFANYPKLDALSRLSREVANQAACALKNLAHWNHPHTHGGALNRGGDVDEMRNILRKLYR